MLLHCLGGAGHVCFACVGFKWKSQVGSKDGELWDSPWGVRAEGLPRTDTAAVLDVRAAQLGARWLRRHIRG